LSQELQLTAVVAAMEYAPSTRKSNNDAQEKQHEAKQKKKELMKDKVSFAVIALASQVLVVSQMQLTFPCCVLCFTF
jgi:hypothetical protein